MTSSKSNKYTLSIPSSTQHLSKVEKLCSTVARDANLNASEGDDLAIAVTELVNNAIQHGNKHDPDKLVSIDIKLVATTITVTIKDQGNGFNPESIKDPLAPENLLKESGRGIFLIKQLMDDIKFTFKKDGTEVTIVKKIGKNNN